MIKKLLLLMVSMCFLFSMIIGSVLVPSSLQAGDGGGLPPPPDAPEYVDPSVGDSTIALTTEPTNEEPSLVGLVLMYFLLIL